MNGSEASRGRRLGPYLLAAALLTCDYLFTAHGLAQVRAGTNYAVWALDHGGYSDVLKLSLDHYVRVGQVVHPLPYVHDRIEYPVLLGFLLWLPSWLPGGPATWLAAAGVMVAAATFGSIALLERARPGSAWWLAASPALLVDSAINWDLIGIFFLVGAVVWFAEARLALSGAATAVGTFVKLFPVVVAPIALAALTSRLRHERSDAAGGGQGSGRSEGRGSAAAALAGWVLPFATVSLVVVVPFLVVNPQNTLWFFRYNSLRTEKDSVWGLLGRMFGTSMISHHVIDVCSLVVVAAVLAAVSWAVWRVEPSHQGRAVALASAVAVIAWMAVNKVWNPQYVLWVFAAGAITAMPARYAVVLGAVSVLDYVFEFVLRVPDHTNPYSWVGYTAVVARTAVFVAMAAWSLRRLRELPTAPAVVPDERLPAPAPT